MHMAGEQKVAAPRQKVWEALNDPAVLQAAIPGCQSLDKEGDDRFAAVVEVKIGPIGARFKGAVALSDIDPGNSYTIAGQGSGGVAGSAKGSAKVRLSDDGAGTLVSYEVDADVGGRMAQLGGPIIDATAKQLAGKFFSKLGEIVGSEAAAEKAAESVAAAEPPAEVTATAYPLRAGAAGEGVPAEPQAEVTASAQPLQSSAPVPGGGFPWSWAVALVLALAAGFVLGRSTIAEWWVIVVAVLVIAAAGAGYDSGRRGGGRP